MVEIDQGYLGRPPNGFSLSAVRYWRMLAPRVSQRFLHVSSPKWAPLDLHFCTESNHRDSRDPCGAPDHEIQTSSTRSHPHGFRSTWEGPWDDDTPRVERSRSFDSGPHRDDLSTWSGGHIIARSCGGEVGMNWDWARTQDILSCLQTQSSFKSGRMSVVSAIVEGNVEGGRRRKYIVKKWWETLDATFLQKLPVVIVLKVWYAIWIIIPCRDNIT